MSPDQVEDFLLEGAPDDYVCPLAMVLMTSPVVAEDGMVYQRDALEQYIAYASQRRCRCWELLALTPTGAARNDSSHRRQPRVVSQP